MVRIGIIGLGYWGPNLIRAMESVDQAVVTTVCDIDRRRLSEVSRHFPHVLATTDLDVVLDPAKVDAVAIATPTSTHALLARRALERGLHVFVEKPLATRSAHCEELIGLANRAGRVLFVGHVFLYTAAVAKLRELIDTGEVGHVWYISSTRVNLGPVRRDVNALWDLAPHDISIILHLVGELPESVNCQGVGYLNQQVHDVCSLTMQFPSGTLAIVLASWLDPNKVRRMTVVGDRKMAVYDDVDPQEKIKIYDKGIQSPPYHQDFAEFQFSYRYGDTHSPRLLEEEPLKVECRHFVECIVQGTTPRTDGRNGLDVVRVLEAADVSLHDSGGRVQVAPAAEPAESVRSEVRV